MKGTESAQDVSASLALSSDSRVSIGQVRLPGIGPVKAIFVSRVLAANLNVPKTIRFGFCATDFRVKIRRQCGKSRFQTSYQYSLLNRPLILVQLTSGAMSFVNNDSCQQCITSVEYPLCLQGDRLRKLRQCKEQQLHGLGT